MGEKVRVRAEGVTFGFGMQGRPAVCVLPFVFHKLLDTLFPRSQLHPNRFVREVSHFIVGTISRVITREDLAVDGAVFVQPLADGLTDNWSQVGEGSGVYGGGDTRSLVRVPGVRQ